MPGWWIKLNDTRVRADQGDGDPLDVIRAIERLYLVPEVLADDLRNEIDERRRRAESGEDWAAICALESELYDLGFDPDFRTWGQS